MIDLVVTRVPNESSFLDVFRDDLSDHCDVAAVMNAKVRKLQQRILTT